MKFAFLILWLSLGVYGAGQGLYLYPEDAQVNLYFPHLADGGTGGQRWQTRFTFVNPSTTTTANVALFTFADDGSAWSLDLGFGARSQLDFTVPPQGRVTFTSQIASPNITTGSAGAFSDIPLQATWPFAP